MATSIASTRKGFTVRRHTVPCAALLLLASAIASSAADQVKAAGKDTPPDRPVHRARKRLRHAVAARPTDPTGPFTDVPRGHWAYDAIRKAADAGLMQGWQNEFHGKQTVNRYQMAVVVARLLDRASVLKIDGRTITGKDIANLEALCIEFADELSLLNVKVSKLESTIAALKGEVDLVKSEFRSTGGRAGITGTAQIRAVATSDGDNLWGSGSFLTGRAPAPSANTSLLRYHGGAVSGSGTLANPYQFDNRVFGTVSNFAVNFDRQFDPKVHFHAQVDINAEGSRDATGAQLNATGYIPVQPAGALTGSTPAAGRGENFSFNGADIMVNEAYVTWSDWYRDGVAARAGIFAVPMDFEVNGPSRTYQWTITPSVANAKWESIRPVGLDVFQHNADDALAFHVGVFTPGDTVNGVPRSGALLTAPTAFSAVPGGSNVAAGPSQLDPLANPAGAAFGLGRFPTPLSAAMTDGPRGVDGQTLSSTDVGYFAMVGGHPIHRDHQGFTWQVAYLDRNGTLRPAPDRQNSLTDWYAWQVAANYQWRKLVVAAQYFDATSRNYSTTDVLAGSDPRRLNTTPFINAAGVDTRSREFMALLNWQFTKRGSVTVRFEAHRERQTDIGLVVHDEDAQGEPVHRSNLRRHNRPPWRLRCTAQCTITGSQRRKSIYHANWSKGSR